MCQLEACQSGVHHGKSKVRNTTFEGVSGIVSFDEFGDRATASELWNLQLDDQGSEFYRLVSRPSHSFLDQLKILKDTLSARGCMTTPTPRFKVGSKQLLKGLHAFDACLS